MEKRFVNFMVMSMLIMSSYILLQAWVNPRKPVDPADQQAAADGERVEDADADDDQADPGAADDDQPGDEKAPVQPKKQAPHRLVSMGSNDPESPYQMQVVANSRGATVEIIELNDPRFTDDEDRGAYLGYLSLTNAEGGCEVNVVPAGSPASKAVPTGSQAPVGLQPGDVIFKVNESPISDTQSLADALAKLKFKSKLEVSVKRQDREITFQVQSRRRPVAVIQPEPFLAEQHHPLSFLWSLDRIGGRVADSKEDELSGIPSLRNEEWETEYSEVDGKQTVQFTYVLDADDLKEFNIDGNLKIVKRYQLAPASDDKSQPMASGYHLTLDIEVLNESDQPVEFGYRFDGPTGLPLEGWWYSYKTHQTEWGRAGVRDVVWRTVGARHQMMRNALITQEFRKSPQNPEKELGIAGKQDRMRYAGVDAQYFTVGLIPIRKTEEDDTFVYDKVTARVVDGIDPLRESRTDVSYRLVSRPVTLAAGESFKESFIIYAGPKKPTILAEYGLGEVISYGWFPMVARPLQLVLHFFYRTIGNYGLAIILLTVVVKGCMFPLGRKQAANAKKMQELAPEMKKLAEKYKNDMEKRAQAQQELFRKHNCHPLSGCLPSLIQLPIFVGLYKALSIDIELRQAPLIPGIQWCSNLAAPDRLWHWESLPLWVNGVDGALGPYMNILPLISAALFLVQQKMFMPPAQDEQQQMQQQMMKFMPIMMCFIFWKVPAGLCIYFIASSIWSMAERQLLPKSDVKQEETADIKDENPPKEGLLSKLNPNKPKPTPNGASKKRQRAERAARAKRKAN